MWPFSWLRLKAQQSPQQPRPKDKGQIGERLGAKEIIYYRDESPDAYVKRLTNGEGFDIVFDTVGGTNIDQAFKAAANNGQVITIVSQKHS